MLAAIGIGMLFTLLPWGFAADRFDERAVIAVGLVGAGVAFGVAAETTGFGALVGALIAAGALGASVNAASGRAIMGWFPPGELGLALGIRQTAIPIGGALGAGVLPVARRDAARASSRSAAHASSARSSPRRSCASVARRPSPSSS